MKHKNYFIYTTQLTKYSFREYQISQIYRHFTNTSLYHSACS